MRQAVLVFLNIEKTKGVEEEKEKEKESKKVRKII